jgi:hypothetical protein
VSGAARGILVGGTVAGLGGFAHVTASGGLEPRSLLLAVGLAMAVGGSLVRRVRWTFARALVAAVAAQPVLHVVLAGGGHAGGHAHAAHHAAATSADERMWILHTVLAVASAVLLREGGRWLRTMPALVRAVCLGVAPAGALQTASPAGRWTATDDSSPRPIVALAWSSRAPPSPT